MLQGAADAGPSDQARHLFGEPSSAPCGPFERLPADIFAGHIWSQLARRERQHIRLVCRGLAQYTASELMSHLQVLVCRASLMQLTGSGQSLHSRFPHPATLTLRLLPPVRRDDRPAGGLSEGDAGGGLDGAGGSAGAVGSSAADGWHGSTAVMSYFLSELGGATSVTALSLQGWQELTARDLYHVASCHPRLARLHLVGLPFDNYLSGPALESLARSAPCLRELVVDAQLVMDVQAALAALSRLPLLSSLELSGLPLLPSLDLPMAPLTHLTRLTLTFEHKHAHSEQQLAGLGKLTLLRHLALDFMQLGTGSSLWSAGWLLSHVINRLTALNTLHLPRAFLYDKSHPDFLHTLASLPYLTDLALGSIILSPETAAAAGACGAEAATGAANVGAAGGGGNAASFAAATAPAATPPSMTFRTEAGTPGPAAPATSDPRVGSPPDSDGGVGSASSSAQPFGLPATTSSLFSQQQPGSLLVRPWRRLALGAAMPCYLECLLPVLGVPPTVPVPGNSSESGGIGAVQPATPPPLQTPASVLPESVVAAAQPPQSTPPRAHVRTIAGPSSLAGLPPPYSMLSVPSPLLSRPGPATPGVAGSLSSTNGMGQAGGGLELLELSTPCTLQMVQLLAHFAHDSGGGGGGGGDCIAATSVRPPCVSSMTSVRQTPAGVREVRLLLRLASNWREVVAGLAAVGQALTSLALMPTYMYGSGTMMGSEVLASVASSLPHLIHLELYRLNVDPRDVACLADLPYLRYIFLGVANEVRDRRGPGHPARLVTALLAALSAPSLVRAGRRCVVAGQSCGKKAKGAAERLPACGGTLAGSGRGAAVMEFGGGASCFVAGAEGGSVDVGGEAWLPGSGGPGRTVGPRSGSGQAAPSRGPGDPWCREERSEQGLTRGPVPDRMVVVCCPELTEEEAARLDEACEVEYRTCGLHGGGRWLRVERLLDETLPQRLSVGCSMAPGRWRP